MLHSKTRFVWNDRNCTTLPNMISTFSDSWVCFRSFNFLNNLLPSSVLSSGCFLTLRAHTLGSRYSPVIETISFSTAHQSRVSLSPFLSEEGAIYPPKSWFCSARDAHLVQAKLSTKTKGRRNLGSNTHLHLTAVSECVELYIHPPPPHRTFPVKNVTPAVA